MKKYFHILVFAFKEQLEYRRNFFVGMITMIVNDMIFLMIFVIFLGYFSGTGMSFGNFLLIHSILAFQYAIVNGLFSNIGDLPTIIEEGKLDYYLSFPTQVLGFITCSKIKVHNIGDVLFALVAAVMYAIYFHQGSSFLFLGKRGMVSAFALFFGAGLFILVGSISFRLQKGSKVRDLFQSFFLVFGSYPPDIFRHDKLIFVMISLIGLYPGIFLPYQMLLEKTTPRGHRYLLIGASILMFVIGIRVFYRGLKRYSSGNLVMQM